MKHCVVIDDTVYGWDETRKRFVAAKLQVDESIIVPDEAVKLISMKRFNLVEGQEFKPVLEYCIIDEDKAYCWDETNQRFVVADLVPAENQERIPEEAIKLVLMNRFDIKE